MGMPPRQPQAVPADGAPDPDDYVTTDAVPSFEHWAQRALDISRAALPYVPVAGPAYEMGENLRKGNYAGALFDGAMLAADLSPIGPADDALRVLGAVNKMRRGTLLARARTATERIRTVEKVGPGYEIHHTIPMKGLSPISAADRDAEGLLRNHPFNLKILPEDIHRKVHGTFGNRYTDPFLKAWHGTNALQKSAAAATTGYAAQVGKNVTGAFDDSDAGAVTGQDQDDLPFYRW